MDPLLHSSNTTGYKNMNENYFYYHTHNTVHFYYKMKLSITR
jgi:hypothetical protein